MNDTPMKTIKVNKAASTPWEKLKETAEWATTTERRNIELDKETLFWIVAELTRWELIRGLDLDLADEELADEPQDLSNVEDTL
jgi:hypothetical protein